MKKIIAEFKEFISRGNVMDMAIGVIIATAFGKITTSLVNDVLMPFISWLVGARDMSALNLLVRPEVLNDAGEVVQESITIGFGTLLGTVIDFILVALVVFAIVKAANMALGPAGKAEGSRGRSRTGALQRRKAVGRNSRSAEKSEVTG